MAAILQLRRGTSNASPVLTESELYLHQGVGSIQFGSGSSTYTLLPLNAPVNGNIKLVGDISASNLTLTGNLTVAQNITFGGTLITFGDANTDNVVITADLSSSIIPNDTNAFDLGASNKKWKNLYAVSASIDSILVPGSGILSSSNTSFANAASIDSHISNLNSATSSYETKGRGIVSGSSQITYVDINSIPAGIVSGSSQITFSGISSLPTLVSSSSQVDATSTTNFNSGIKTKLDAETVVSGSSQINLGSVTGNSTSNVTEGTNLYYTDARVKTKLDAETLISGSSQVNADSITNFDSNVKAKLDAETVVSGSSQITFSGISVLPTLVSGSSQITITSTAGFTDYSGSVSASVNTLSSSINLDLARIHESTSSLNLYTQSLKDAITVSGQDAASTTTIKGNLVVQGTQTSINSTAIVLGDNIIELNGTGVANGGLLVKDPTDASIISGSLLWDSTNDYWKAGQLGGESKILLAGGDGIVSSSAQVTSLLPSGVVSGSQQITSSLDNRYLMIDGDSVVSSSAQIVSILSDLNSYTSSQDTKNTTLGTYSGSNDTKWNTLSNVTASLINATSSYETNGRGIISGSSQVTPLLPTGVVSGSSQITYSDISSISVGIVSGSSQVTPLLPTGVVSGSSQVVYTALTSIPAGIVSGSLQIPSLLPNGVVSGSNQLTSSYNLLYAPSASFATLLGANTLASLGSAAFYYVTSSADIVLVSGSINYTNNHLLTAGATKKYIDWRTEELLAAAAIADILSVSAGDGLGGGGLSGDVTLTLDTGSTHFRNGVDARLIPLTSLNSYTSSQDTKNLTLGTYTSSLETKNLTLASYTSSNNTTQNEQNSRLNNLELYTASVPSLNSLNSYTSSQDTKNSTLATYTSSLETKNSTLATYTSSLETKNLTLATYTASVNSQLSNLTLATSSYETKGRGIISGSSQLSGTTITDLTIVNLTTVNETASVIFSSGSNRFGDFGNDTHAFTGSVQISGSLTTIGASTATSFNGVINATNGVISGSSQLIATLPTGVVSGSSQIILLLPTGVVSGSAQTIANLPPGTISGSQQVTRTLQQITDTGATTSNAITITNATASTNKTTGALIVTGGIGVNGDINAGGDIVAFASSDIRLKNNIKPIESPLEKISKINGCEFEWNAELQTIYSGKDYGVIAQEIEEVFPELVQTRENGYKAVKYDKLVSVLIEGIKELTKQVEYLKTKIEN
jgi:hypothetical protein